MQRATQTGRTFDEAARDTGFSYSSAASTAVPAARPDVHPTPEGGWAGNNRVKPGRTTPARPAGRQLLQGATPKDDTHMGIDRSRFA